MYVCMYVCMYGQRLCIGGCDSAWAFFRDSHVPSEYRCELMAIIWEEYKMLRKSKLPDDHFQRFRHGDSLRRHSSVNEIVDFRDTCFNWIFSELRICALIPRIRSRVVGHIGPRKLKPTRSPRSPYLQVLSADFVKTSQVYHIVFRLPLSGIPWKPEAVDFRDGEFFWRHRTTLSEGSLSLG